LDVYCDSSLKASCVVIEGRIPVVSPYHSAVTNNVGEYQAVLDAIALALKLEAMDVEIFSDSQLVVNQVSGVWQCRKRHLLPLRNAVRKGLKEAKYKLSWVPREKNLAGKILG